MAPRGSTNWTYKDYVELPDDGNRYEILGGVLYVDGDIVTRHQLIVIRLWRVLSRYAEQFDRGEVAVRIYARVAGGFERVAEFGNGGTITTPILAGFALDTHDVFRA